MSLDSDRGGDSSRLDWIEKEVWRQGGGTFKIERGRGGPLIVFTVASQHVYGFNLRQAIDHAEAAAEGRRNAARQSATAQVDARSCEQPSSSQEDRSSSESGEGVR
jgi:hypothetical protein